MRYVLGVVGFIILAIITVVLFTTVITERDPGQQTGENRVELQQHSDSSAEFSFTTQGEVVGYEDFRAIRIKVTPSNRTVQVLSSYDENVVSEQTFANTQSAYEVFVAALENAGYSRERDNENRDVTGACPLGRRSIYQIKQGSETVLDLWSSTCGRRDGNFGGDVAEVRQLFQNQIPNYREFVKDIKL